MIVRMALVEEFPEIAEVAILQQVEPPAMALPPMREILLEEGSTGAKEKLEMEDRKWESGCSETTDGTIGGVIWKQMVIVERNQGTSPRLHRHPAVGSKAIP